MMNYPDYKKNLTKKIFSVISDEAALMGVRAFVIGGYVRDTLMGNKSKDIDIVVEGSGIDLASRVAAKLRVNLSVFKNFGTAMLRYKDTEIEFVGARKESYRRNSRKPIVEDGTLRDDQLRRDFTINALAFSLQKDNYGELTDPFNGLEDLHNGIIRTPLDPDTTYSDDPLRMIRAVRFASRFSFSIVDDSLESIKRNRDRISILSMERIADELNKIIMSSKPSAGFYLLDTVGLLELILPSLVNLKGVESIEGKQHKDNFTHTLQVLDNVAAVSDNLWLRWAGLLHDIGKPLTKSFEPGTGWSFHGHEFVGSKMVPRIFARLKLPQNEKMKYVEKLVLLHLRPIALVQEEVTDSAVRRLLFDAGDDIDDLMTLCEADITSANEYKVTKHKNNFALVRRKLIEVEEKDAVRNFKNPVTGEYIMKYFNIPPGRVVGEIKEYIKNAILDGEIGNNFEEAKDLMVVKAKELGL
jgi:poly(A) polymerase